MPGYERVVLHPATRFIGTMNYGYAGTKELNEALVSRFVVINMPSPDEETLNHILKSMYPTLKESATEQFVSLFLDLQTKAQNSEISAKALDLRGLLAAIGLMKIGLSPIRAIHMGVGNKSFDLFEREMVEDIIMTRIPSSLEAAEVFED